MARKTLNIRGYAAPSGMKSAAHKTAHFLNWAADKYPYQFTQYNILLRAIQGYSRTPHMTSREVETFRHAVITRVRYILRDDYGRDMVTERMIGVRATVDSADTLTTALPRRVARAENAALQLRATAALINLKDVPDTIEYAPWKSWMKKSVSDALRLADSLTVAKAALPAPNETDQ